MFCAVLPISVRLCAEGFGVVMRKQARAPSYCAASGQRRPSVKGNAPTRLHMKLGKRAPPGVLGCTANLAAQCVLFLPQEWPALAQRPMASTRTKVSGTSALRRMCLMQRRRRKRPSPERPRHCKLWWRINKPESSSWSAHWLHAQHLKCLVLTPRYDGGGQDLQARGSHQDVLRRTPMQTFTCRLTA